jgi:uncharacterized protein YdeI (YjbR/CyaY-like superfamily)
MWLESFRRWKFFHHSIGKNLEKIQKKIGDKLKFELVQDPNPLGVAIPEVLEILIAQDEDLNSRFTKLTLGKKRSIIHQMNKIKDIDKQISKTIELINNANQTR